MEFSRPEYCSGLPFPSPGDLPHPEMEPRSPALQVDSLPSEPKSMFGLFLLMRIHSLYTHPNVFVHESATVRLDCFWFGAIIANAIMNNHVYVLM